MKNFLLIYSLVPEDTKYFAIPIDHPNVDLIKQAHGVKVNVDDLTIEQDYAFSFVNDATAKPEFAGNPDNGGILLEFAINESDLISQPFEFVINVTFYL